MEPFSESSQEEERANQPYSVEIVQKPKEEALDDEEESEESEQK